MISKRVASKESIAIRLNPEIDRLEVSRSLATSGRVHIKLAIDPASADQISQYLLKDALWNTIFNEHEEISHSLSKMQMSLLSTAQRNTLYSFLRKRARSTFTYIYQTSDLQYCNEESSHGQSVAKQIHEFFNGKEFLSFVREISGISTLSEAETQATQFKKNHFITRHTDVGAEYHGRRMAFVLSLTREWRAEWGGILEFLDENGNVTEGFTPSFNSLNLFYVPVLHHVSCVSHISQGKRISISGWLRDP